MNDLIDATEMIKKLHHQGYIQGLNAARAEIAELISETEGLKYGEFNFHYPLDVLDKRLINIINKSEHE